MKLRDRRFEDEFECIKDVEELKRGHRAGGKWTLAQACWHLKYPLERALRLPEENRPTDEQQRMQSFIDQVIASGWPEGANSPKEMLPPPNVEPAAIDQFMHSMHLLAEYTAEQVDGQAFGPVDARKYRKFTLIHAAHHLSFYEPTD